MKTDETKRRRWTNINERYIKEYHLTLSSIVTFYYSYSFFFTVIKNNHFFLKIENEEISFSSFLNSHSVSL